MENNEIRHNSTRKRAMLIALEDSYGVVTPACKAIGIDRGTHYNWYNEDEEYRTAVDELKNVAIDHSESKLHELISGVTVENGIDLETGETIVYKKEPNVAAVIFHLKTIGKKRGYVEKEVERAPDLEQLQPPNVTFVSQDMSNNATTT